MSTMNTKAKLTVTETKNKAGKYHYKVVDIETGKVISERKSNRQYIAATYEGTYYFGRIDLAQKHVARYPHYKIAYIE